MRGDGKGKGMMLSKIVRRGGRGLGNERKKSGWGRAWWLRRDGKGKGMVLRKKTRREGTGIGNERGKVGGVGHGG